MAGSEAPKITTTGRPKAAAMCAGPESLPRNSDGAAQQGFDFAERRADHRAEVAKGGQVVARPGDEYRVEIQRFAQVTARRRGNRSAGQVLSGCDATGWITA